MLLLVLPSRASSRLRIPSVRPPPRPAGGRLVLAPPSQHRRFAPNP